MASTVELSVAVAIATYNGARFLQPLLDSLTQQSRQPDQIIVSDDGSSDQTLAMITTYSKNVPFDVVIVKNPATPGILNNFYSAFAATTADIIFYCDQDDVWHPQKIERLLAEFADPDVQAVIHRSRIVDQDLVDTGKLIHENAHWGAIKSPVDCLSVHGFGHQMAMRRSVLTTMQALQGHVTGTPSIYANNFDRMIPFCASLLGRIVLLQDALVDFRRHGDSATTAGKESGGGSSWLNKARWLAQGHSDSARLCDYALTVMPGPPELIEQLKQAHFRSANLYERMLEGAEDRSIARSFFTLFGVTWHAIVSTTRFSKTRRIKDCALAITIFLRRLISSLN